MKILVVSNLYPPDTRGGYEILCQQVCERLARLGNQVDVLTTGDGERESQNAVSVRRDLKLLKDFDEPLELKRAKCGAVAASNEEVTGAAIAELRPDVVFVWSQLRLTLGAARAAEASGVPILYSLNDEHLVGYVPRGGSISPMALTRSVADHTVFRGETTLGLELEEAICISDLLNQRLEDRGLHVQRTTILHQGIPVDSFPVKEHPGELHDPVRLLYVGQLHDYKGVHDFVGALQHLDSISPARYRATVVGAGDIDYQRELWTQACKGPIPVDFRGRLDSTELPAIYREHDVFVFPSIWPEPFGLTHLESMASGTPVVSTARGGQAELLRHEDNALVVEPESPKQIAAAIERLRADDRLRHHLVTTALRDVREQHSLDGYVRRIERVLRGRAA